MELHSVCDRGGCFQGPNKFLACAAVKAMLDLQEIASLRDVLVPLGHARHTRDCGIKFFAVHGGCVVQDILAVFIVNSTYGNLLTDLQRALIRGKLRLGEL